MAVSFPSSTPSPQFRDHPTETENQRLSVIRAFSPDDLAAVTELFLRIFRNQRKVARSADLTDCLREVLYRPERPASIPPGLIYSGPCNRVDGFVACLPQPMRLDDRSLMGHGGGLLMLDPDRRGDALALIRLLRAFFDVPSAVCFTDTASAVARKVVERMGAVYLPLQSIDWVVVRSRGGFLVRAGLDRVRLQALDRAIGASARAWIGWSKTPSKHARRVRFISPTEQDLVSALSALSKQQYAFAPDWEHHQGMLQFRLREATKLRRHGLLQTAIAVNTAGDPVGCWLAQFKPGGIARVLQVLAVPDQVGAVLGDLIERSDRHGCVALRGRAQPEIVAGLSHFSTFFLPRLSTLVWASDPAILARCVQGPSLLTGLAGETWSRLMDDDFE